MAAVVAHLCLGSVYAWSVFVEPIGTLAGWHKPQITWAFSVAIASLGLTAAFGATLMQQLGPRRSVVIAGVLYSAGLMSAGAACRWQSLPLLYVGFGLIGGMGLGMGYAPPVATLLRWFPDKRGLATGMAVCGFGAGALVASQIAERLLPAMGCVATFYTLAGVYLPLIVVAGMVMRLPPEGFNPAPAKSATPDADARIVPVSSALATARFWLLWSVFYVNIAVGIMLIALAKPMAQDLGGLSGSALLAVVPTLAIFNAAGRLGWSSLSDFIGRPATFLAMLAIQVALFSALPSVQGAVFFLALMLIISCYGGGFALTPAYIADLFGGRSTGPIYGAALAAWSAAAISGPPLGAYLVEYAGGYGPAIYAAAGLLVIGAILVMLLARLSRKSIA